MLIQLIPIIAGFVGLLFVVAATRNEDSLFHIKSLPDSRSNEDSIYERLGYKMGQSTIRGWQNLIKTLQEDEPFKWSDLSDDFLRGEKEDEFIYLLIASAHFIKIDGKFYDKEYAYVERYLSNYWPPSQVKAIMDILYKFKHIVDESDTICKDLWEIEPSLFSLLTTRARETLSYGTKLKMLHFIRGLCGADMDFAMEEETSLFRWAKSIGIPGYDSYSGYDDNSDYKKIMQLAWDKKLDPAAIMNELGDAGFDNIMRSEYTFLNNLHRSDKEVDDYIEKLNMAMSQNKKRGPKTSTEDKKKPMSQEDLSYIKKLKESAEKEKAQKKELRKHALRLETDFIETPLIKEQLELLDEKLRMFMDVISQKLDVTDPRFNQYRKTIEEVYSTAVENIRLVGNNYKSLMQIEDKFSIEFANVLHNKIKDLKPYIDNKLKEFDLSMQKDRDRLSLFEKEVEFVNKLLKDNEEAIFDIDEASVEVGLLEKDGDQHSEALEEAIRELDAWTDKVKLYQKRGS